VRILVVDDNEDFRDLTEPALASAGYSDICVADSASEAFRLMDIGVASSNDVPQVDMVLLDVVCRRWTALKPVLAYAAMGATATLRSSW
jgi:CheY-like chemotaxis protein